VCEIRVGQEGVRSPKSMNARGTHAML